jgi:hypothetical protein
MMPNLIVPQILGDVEVQGYSGAMTLIVLVIMTVILTRLV